MSQLISYEKLRDRINDSLDQLQLGIDELDVDEAKSLLRDLISERRMIVEEIDELRESQYGWITHANNRMHGMKLLLSNMDEEAYNTLQAKSSRLGLEDGELLNELMNKAISKARDGEIPELSSKDIVHLGKDKGHITIEHLPELAVTKKDLDETRHRVKFSHINNLRISEDINNELFSRKIKGINHCGLVSFPANISKLLVFAKAGYCSEYEFYGEKP